MNMLLDYIINRMTEDELRNYIAHVRRVYNIQRDAIVADGYLVEALECAYRHRNHREDCLMELNIAKDSLVDIQNELEEKYGKPDDLSAIGVCCDTEGD